MADLFDNPMGLMGFEFVEFASPTPNVLEPVFEMMGFTQVAQHRSKNVSLYRQGDINFIINNEKESFANDFKNKHGSSICALAVRTKIPAKQAMEIAEKSFEEKLMHLMSNDLSLGETSNSDNE